MSAWVTEIVLGLACTLGGAACGNVSGAGSRSDAGDAPPIMDAGGISDAEPLPDAPPAATVCDPLAKFGPLTPVVIPGLDGLLKHSANLSLDELTMYFDAIAPNGDSNLYITTRTSRAAAWGQATALTSVNSSKNDDRPSVSSDGLALWFVSNRIANESEHIFVATRASTLASFGTPEVASINATDTSVPDAWPFQTADNQELWLASERVPTQGLFDIWRAPAVGKGFGTPVQVLELDSMGSDGKPMLSADRLTLYLGSTRPGTGTKGSFDIWRTHRQNVADGFPAPVLVPELNSAKSDFATWISPDGCRIYITANDGTTDAIYVASRTPR
jgi:hypothetical protein